MRKICLSMPLSQCGICTYGGTQRKPHGIHEELAVLWRGEFVASQYMLVYMAYPSEWGLTGPLSIVEIKKIPSNYCLKGPATTFFFNVPINLKWKMEQWFLNYGWKITLYRICLLFVTVEMHNRIAAEERKQ